MEKAVRIVFMGTPEFAVPSLEILLAHKYHLVGVVTVPDKPAGRGRKLTASPVKRFALANDLNLLQPPNLKDPAFIEELKALQPDLQVVVAFRMLPEAVWMIPCLGTFNLHASLLPKYRGAAPINWAIINGEKQTGITTFFINNEIDKGDVLLKETSTIGLSQTAGELHDELMKKGSQLVLRTVKGIVAGSLQSHSQLPIDDLKTAPKIYKNDCRINWKADAGKIFNKIRGLCPFPGAWTLLKNPENKEVQLKVFATDKESSLHNMECGSLDTDGKTYLKVRCLDGSIILKEVQLEGKKKNSIDAFLRGANLNNEWTVC